MLYLFMQMTSYFLFPKIPVSNAMDGGWFSVTGWDAKTCAKPIISVHSMRRWSNSCSVLLVNNGCGTFTSDVFCNFKVWI